MRETIKISNDEKVLENGGNIWSNGSKLEWILCPTLFSLMKLGTTCTRCLQNDSQLKEYPSTLECQCNVGYWWQSLELSLFMSIRTPSRLSKATKKADV